MPKSVPVPASEPNKAPVSPVEPQTPPEGTEHAPEPVDASKAATDRLRQQQARNNKLLASLGLDPMSDLAEQLEQGVITPDMLQRHMMDRWGIQPNQPQVQAPQGPVSPVQEAQQRLQAAKQAYQNEAREGGVSLETNSEYLEAIEALNEAKLAEVRGQVTAEKTQQTADQNLNVILNDARSAEYYPTMPAELQTAVDMTSVAVTGIIADREARKAGLDPARLTPQQVAYFSGKAQATLGSLAEHFIKVGEERVRSGLRPQIQTNTPVMPVPAGGGGNPAVPNNPFVVANVQNHQQLARQYVQGSRQI